jgi:hypothetical protein
MPIELVGQVGLQMPKLANGVNAPLSQGSFGEAYVSELMGRYYALAYNGLLFMASLSAAQALSVASATFTGLAVSNPAGSGKNLIILDAVVALAAAVTAVSTPRLGYAAAVALTTGNAVGPSAGIAGSGAASVAKVGASATLGAAPTTMRALMGVDWVTGGTPVAAIYAKDDIGGAIIIPPGQMATIDALVGACSVIPSLTWAELPI